ncbi:MAG: class I SAM-dependent methyltransferase [Xanthomonadales bacterium]|nr:class I SAM-dependent methyltransferase [Xanthomonadales bacterium]
MSENRWASGRFPSNYRQDVNESIAFSGLDVDMFARGKAADLLDLLRVESSIPAMQATCLDIGCGIGVSHPLIVDDVGSLVGVDVSVDAVEIAREANAKVEYRVQHHEALPFDSECFDFCSTVCVMHHVPPGQWPAFVAEAWRVTKPGGLFAVYEHNPVNPMTRWAVWRCPFDHDAVLLRAGKVCKLLQKQGFEMVTRRYLFFMPSDRPWARRFDRLLRWLPLGAQYVVCARRPVGGGSAGVENPA